MRHKLKILAIAEPQSAQIVAFATPNPTDLIGDAKKTTVWFTWSDEVADQTVPDLSDCHVGYTDTMDEAILRGRWPREITLNTETHELHIIF